MPELDLGLFEFNASSGFLLHAQARTASPLEGVCLAMVM
jgi:hypothetical protein